MFDFPNTSRARVEGYIDTLRTADPILHGGGRGIITTIDGKVKHCAMGVIIRTFYGVPALVMEETWKAGIAYEYHVQIVMDLEAVGLPRSFISNRNDFRGLTLVQIADELEAAIS